MNISQAKHPDSQGGYRAALGSGIEDPGCETWRSFIPSPKNVHCRLLRNVHMDVCTYNSSNSQGETEGGSKGRQVGPPAPAKSVLAFILALVACTEGSLEAS
jgi:hypothetical protein